MILERSFTLTNSNSSPLIVDLPNLCTSHHLIPAELEFLQKMSKDNTSERRRPLDKIDCSVRCGSVELLKYDSPMFDLTNIINLKPYQVQLNCGHLVHIKICNRHTEVRDIVLIIRYKPSLGNLIYQNRVCDTDYSSLLETIGATHHVTRLIIKSRPENPMKEAKFVPLFNEIREGDELVKKSSEDEEDEAWLLGFDIENDDASLIDINFTEDPALFSYSSSLQLYQFTYEYESKSEINLDLAVIAYGFAK